GDAREALRDESRKAEVVRMLASVRQARTRSKAVNARHWSSWKTSIVPQTFSAARPHLLGLQQVADLRQQALVRRQRGRGRRRGRRLLAPHLIHHLDDDEQHERDD